MIKEYGNIFKPNLKLPQIQHRYMIAMDKSSNVKKEPQKMYYGNLREFGAKKKSFLLFSQYIETTCQIAITYDARCQRVA